MTLRELMSQLKRLDEVTLLETLDISSEDIVEKFADEIEERFEELTEAFEDEDDEEE